MSKKKLIISLILSFSLACELQSAPKAPKSLIFTSLSVGTMVSSVFINLWSLERFLDYYDIQNPDIKLALETLAVTSTVYVMSATKLYSLWQNLNSKENVDPESHEQLLPNTQTSQMTFRDKFIRTFGTIARAFPAREVLSASTLLSKAHIHNKDILIGTTVVLSLSEIATYQSFNIPKSLDAYQWLFDPNYKEVDYVESSQSKKKIAIIVSLIPLAAGATSYLYAIEKGTQELFQNTVLSHTEPSTIIACCMTAGLLSIDLPMKFRALYKYIGRRHDHPLLKISTKIIHHVLGLSFTSLSFTVDYRAALHIGEKIGLPKFSWYVTVPAAILSALNSIIVREVLVRHIEDNVLPKFQIFLKPPPQENWDIIF